MLNNLNKNYEIKKFDLYAKTSLQRQRSVGRINEGVSTMRHTWLKNMQPLNIEKIHLIII